MEIRLATLKNNYYEINLSSNVLILCSPDNNTCRGHVFNQSLCNTVHVCIRCVRVNNNRNLNQVRNLKQKMIVDVYVNGHWDADCVSSNEVTIYEQGVIYQIDESQYDDFIDVLETEGFDCYFCPQLFKNPNWNGIINHI